MQPLGGATGRHSLGVGLHSTPLQHSAAHPSPQLSTNPPPSALEDLETHSQQLPADLREPNVRQAAFRDLHGVRLHGFALLVSLGDRSRAARATAQALEEGIHRSAELRHPERAAAWLRARVLQLLRRGSQRRVGPGDRERRAVLRGLGAADPVFDGLSSLPIKPRAALVASTVEGFDPIDIETILGMAPGSSLRTVTRARERFVAAVTAAAAPAEIGDQPAGELGDRIREVAGRAMGGSAANQR